MKSFKITGPDTFSYNLADARDLIAVLSHVLHDNTHLAEPLIRFAMNNLNLIKAEAEKQNALLDTSHRNLAVMIVHPECLKDANTRAGILRMLNDAYPSKEGLSSGEKALWTLLEGS